jgi:hypothetical protein
MGWLLCALGLQGGLASFASEYAVYGGTAGVVYASLWLSAPVTSCSHSSYFWLGLRNRLARRPDDRVRSPAGSSPPSCSGPEDPTGCGVIRTRMSDTKSDARHDDVQLCSSKVVLAVMWGEPSRSSTRAVYQWFCQ